MSLNKQTDYHKCFQVKYVFGEQDGWLGFTAYQHL